VVSRNGHKQADRPTGSSRRDEEEQTLIIAGAVKSGPERSAAASPTVAPDHDKSGCFPSRSQAAVGQSGPDFEKQRLQVVASITL